jgi:hypothetical protein
MAGAALSAAALCLATLPAMPVSAATAQTAFARWTSTADFAKGTSTGIARATDSVTIGSGTSTTTYDDPHVSGGARTYDRGIWTSPWKSIGFDARSLVPSWSIAVPGGSFARVDVRVKDGSTTGSWDEVGQWALSVSRVVRASDSSQTDDLAKLSTDTIIANSGKTFDAWQVRVQLLRPHHSSDKPTLYAINGTTATYLTKSASTSITTMKTSKELAVPRSSQMIHKGEFPQWGGGGEAWCSPTSTAMVMRYFGKGPSKASYSWSKYTDSFVDHAARYTFDKRYDGTGNWAFNTAYAAHYSLDAFVTRLSSLRDAELFIRAGIPLVAAVAFAKGGLDGAPISSTPGHLLVIAGFTAGGRVIANDPAAATNSSVRRIYSRAQFEKAWLGGSGGAVYVIRSTSKPLPSGTARW